jgi:SAM-dependent methyltransferase
VFRHSAQVYDLLYEATGKDYAIEAAVLHSLIEERAPSATTLLDVACGTGGHLVHLRQWYEVVGVDLDPGMVGEARRRLPAETIVEGDMRSFQLDRRFDAVTCLFSSIGYMTTVQDLDQAVATMVSHLRPGGIFIMDGWVRPEEWNDDEPIRLQHASDDNVTVARMTRSHREGVTTFLEMHHLIGARDEVTYAVDVHEMKLFEAAHYEESLRRAGVIAPEVVPSPMRGRDRYIGVTPSQ